MADSTDQEIAAQLATSPTAQGTGPAPDEVATDQSSLVAQPGDNATVDLQGNPAEIQMPEEAAGPGSAPLSSGRLSVSHKGGNAAARRNADVSGQNDELSTLNKDETNQLADVEKNSTSQKVALDEQARISKEHDAVEAGIRQREYEENIRFAGSEERASAAASAESHKYMAAFVTQMAAARQMAVDPTGPIGSMTSAEVGGMTLANFAQGFLNARYGIKVDVSGQIDKWVDRSIQEQQRRINQATAGAEDQLHLYEIARQTSHDESEARVRYHGLVSAALQSSVLSNGAQYKSDMAAANAAAAAAQIDVETTKAKQQIFNGSYDRTFKANQQKEQIRHDSAMESISSDRMELAAAKQALAARNKPEGKQPLFIPDLSEGGAVKNEVGDITHHAISRMIDPEVPGAPELAKDIVQKSSAESDLQKHLSEAEVFRKQAVKEYENSNLAKVPGSIGERMFAADSEAKRNYDAIKSKIAADLMKMDYKRGNITELNNEINRLPFEKWYQKGNNLGIWKNIHEEARSSLDALVNGPGTMAVDASNPDIQAQLAKQGMVVAKHNGKVGAYQPYTELDKPAADAARADLAVKDAVASTDDSNKPVDTAFKPEADLAEAPTHDFFDKPTQMWSKTMPGAQPKNAIAIDHLAMAIAQPKTFREAHSGKEMPDNDGELRAQSLDALRAIEGTPGNPQSSAYAHQILEVYHEEGAVGVRKLFSVSDEIETK